MKEEIKELFKEFKNPHIKKEKEYTGGKIGAFALIILYFVRQFFFPVKISMFFLKTLKVPLYLYFAFLDILIIGLALFIYRKQLKSQFKSFYKQKLKYFKYILCSLFLYSIINFILVIICNLIVKDIPANQQALESYNMLYLLFGSLIFAPIVEELVFRGSLRKFIRNDKIFIIISGLIFGLIHVVGSGSLVQYIYILDYGLAGMYFAYNYTKFNNIYLNMTLHFILNLMGILNILFRFII